jgi:hypothetical protein
LSDSSGQMLLYEEKKERKMLRKLCSTRSHEECCWVVGDKHSRFVELLGRVTNLKTGNGNHKRNKKLNLKSMLGCFIFVFVFVFISQLDFDF